jgi:hypothetical protein
VHLTLILTAWKFKKPFFVKMKISPGWLKQNIFLKMKNASQKKSLKKTLLVQRFSLKMSFSVCF